MTFLGNAHNLIHLRQWSRGAKGRGRPMCRILRGSSLPNSRARARPDTSKWFHTTQPMSVSEIVAALRRAPHTRAVPDGPRVAVASRLEASSNLPAGRDTSPGLRRARGPKSVDILDSLWPQRQAASPTSSINSPRRGAYRTRSQKHPNGSRPGRAGAERRRRTPTCVFSGPPDPRSEGSRECDG